MHINISEKQVFFNLQLALTTFESTAFSYRANDMKKRVYAALQQWRNRGVAWSEFVPRNEGPARAWAVRSATYLRVTPEIEKSWRALVELVDGRRGIRDFKTQTGR
ncbi:hypothetical protein PMIN01_04646 [Paraphaeosphaeria minitans]|uniref:Uncharacterized protein n=1 Tax=Paraphaeosphaeria minitans TaxID=565426 RepID=A0A9P6KS34_9PLEO|nr:hypothetical protein PMIN01_04646 [Paraphaeosphaeria minitans]